MKFGELLDATSSAMLQTAWLNEALEPVSEFGRRAYAQLAPFAPGHEGEAAESARRIADLARVISAEKIDAMREVLASTPDPLPAISRAAMGEDLDDSNLLELLRFLDAIENAEPSSLTPALQGLAAQLSAGRSGKFGFYLSEGFDPQIAAARSEAQQAQARYDAAYGRLGDAAAQVLHREEIPRGEFIVMRDDVAELPRGVRIVREAPTYFLCELELDEDALEALRKRDEASDEVAKHEQRARARLSQHVRECVSDLEAALESLSQLDLRLAQARFTQKHSCVPAQIETERTLRFHDARYVPLEEDLQTQGRVYEPISLDLEDVAILTGPNMGGKTVALRTCGFIALLAAFGIPVPAVQAECALFDRIAWLGIGEREEAGGLLSSFAREVVRFNDLMARPAKSMLLLVDEFARTTTPHEGKALLVAIVRGLRRRERLAFVATHLAGVAAEAGVRHFAVRGLRDVPQKPSVPDLNAALAALAQSMDYALVEVSEDGDRQTDAIALAQLLGLDEDIVTEAKENIWTR